MHVQFGTDRAEFFSLPPGTSKVEILRMATKGDTRSNLATTKQFRPCRMPYKGNLRRVDVSEVRCHVITTAYE
jgi:hypothetical protein